MKKKAILFLLILSSFCMNITGVFAETTNAEEVNSIELEDARLSDTKSDILFALDIMQKDADDNFALGSEATRMEFTKWIYRMFNYADRNGEAQAADTYFEDVGKYHYGASAVEAMVTRGIVRGYGDGMFRPENTITMSEACSMLVAAAGYDQGSYSGMSVMTYAHTKGLVDGVSKGENEKLTRADAAKLLYNLMFTEVAEYKYSGGTLKVKTGEKFVRTVMNLDYADGVAQAVCGVSLYDEKISDGFIKFGGRQYVAAFDATDDLLGMHGRLFTDMDNDDAVLFYPTKNKVVEVKAENIDGYSDGVYKYFVNGKASKSNVAKDYDLVYNGYYSSDVKNVVPENGIVKLIDNNSDGKSDVIIVVDYKSYVVKSVLTDEVVFENKTADGKNIIINTKDFNEYIIENAKGKNVELSALSSGNVVSIIRNKNNYLKMIISNESVSGKISESSTEDNRMRFKLDEEEYYTVSNYYAKDYNGEIGVKVKIYIDSFGYVAAITMDNSQSSWKFGYIMRVLMDSDNDRINLKLLTEDNKIDTFGVAEKVKMDGVRVSDFNEAYRVLCNAYENFVDSVETGNVDTQERVTTRMVRYKINSENQIIAIDTPERQELFDGRNNVTAEENSFMIRVKGKMYYSPHQKQIKQVYNGNLDLPGEIYVESNTKFFVVPETSNTNPTDDDYFVTNMSGVGFNKDGEFKYMSGYNCSAENLGTDVVVVRMNKGTSSNQRLFVFDRASTMINDKEEVKTALGGYFGGSYQTYAIAEKSENKYNLASFNSGDVLLCEISNDEIVINGIMYNKNGSGTLNSNYFYATDGLNHFNSNYRVVKGMAERVSNGIILLDLNTTDRYNELVKVETVTVYDCSKSRSEAITKESVSNIKTKESYGEDADIILVSTKQGSLYDVVVIRNQQ